jgi:hypothetical protein
VALATNESFPRAAGTESRPCHHHQGAESVADLERREIPAMSMQGFRRDWFSDGEKSREILIAGTGPGVVVIHEVPGVTPEVAAFGRRVADRGMTAVLPVLFGTPGKPATQGYLAREAAYVCISREFACLAKGKSSPITRWLRALCREVHRRCEGPGVGVVGMCATGGLPCR